MSDPRIRLGADIGGTFTDLVLEIDTDQFSTKRLTTYDAPERAILEGVEEVCSKAGISPDQIDQIIHGTTLATNALIERRGARTALITTKGFRDVIEMRTESRFEQYDLNIVLPDPLLPRDQRYVINERIAANGDVLIDIDPDEVRALAETIKSEGYDSIAVGLIHSYANSDHERAVRDSLRDVIPEISISLSSEVSPQMREYERFNTVCANAYIKPMMKSYLDRLVEKLRGIGAACPVFLMHSGGGIISVEDAAEFPVRLVESGPAGGAVFAAHIAARYGLDKVLSFDMGGTTAKICLIKNQQPKTSRVFEVARSYRFKKGSGMPISIPVIDMVEIGAGGGSIAHTDAMRQIRVGPESAGSEPGPACYNRGGTRPAVSDADLVLGRLDPDNFAGGSIKLEKTNAEAALSEHIGGMLEIDQTMAAYGVCETVDENMANAARVHAVENGEDLSTYTMIAFGGAAPLHAGRLCEKLGIDRLLVPPGAGVGSAIGFLRAPFSFEATHSHFMKLSGFDPVTVQTILSELEREASGFVRSCNESAMILADAKVYMRYAGQGSEIPVSLPAGFAASPDGSLLRNLFEDAYTALFGRTVEGMEIEITVWAVNATTPPEDVDPIVVSTSGTALIANAHTDLFDPTLVETVSAASALRTDFELGQALAGPATITERETTTIVPTSMTAIMQADGCIDLSSKTSETSA